MSLEEAFATFFTNSRNSLARIILDPLEFLKSSHSVKGSKYQRVYPFLLPGYGHFIAHRMLMCSFFPSLIIPLSLSLFPFLFPFLTSASIDGALGVDDTWLHFGAVSFLFSWWFSFIFYHLLFSFTQIPHFFHPSFFSKRLKRMENQGNKMEKVTSLSQFSLIISRNDSFFYISLFPFIYTSTRVLMAFVKMNARQFRRVTVVSRLSGFKDGWCGLSLKDVTVPHARKLSLSL